MKRSIGNRSIRWRIALAMALPMLALLGLALWAGALQYERANSQKRAHDLVEFSTVVNTLVHALQLERGTATALLSSNQPELVDVLHQRYQQTDGARVGFLTEVALLQKQPFAPALTQHITRAGLLLDGIDVVRAGPIQGADLSAVLIERYANVIDGLIHVTREVLHAGSFELKLGQNLEAYTRVMQAKEYAGLERALGVAVLASHRADTARLVRLVTLSERQSLLLDAGPLFTQPVVLDGAEGVWSAQQAQALAQMRHAVQQNLGTGQPGGISRERWFSLTTQRIELMRATEERLAENLIQQADLAESGALKTAGALGALTLLTISLAFWFAWRLVRDIIHPLKRITSAMTDLALRNDAIELTDGHRNDEIGEMIRAIGVFRAHLTEAIEARSRRDREAELHKKESYQRALLNNFPFEVWLKNTDGVFLAANKAVSDQLGLASPDAVVGKTDAQLRGAEDALRIHNADQEVMRLRESRVEEQEVPRIDHDGTNWIETWKAPVIDDQGGLLGTVGFSRDITRDRLAQEEIRQLALYDALTGIPNRRLLGERLHLALSQARRDKALLALVFIDLDHFKPVNDTLGHAVGDALLVDASRRIQACLRETDTVARVGGDEFVVLLTSVNHQRNALALAEKIRQSLNEPFDLPGGYRVQISSSSGVALYPEHGETEEELSENADKAMYQAKQTGRNRVSLYSPHVPASTTVAPLTSLRAG